MFIVVAVVDVVVCIGCCCFLYIWYVRTCDSIINNSVTTAAQTKEPPLPEHPAHGLTMK